MSLIGLKRRAQLEGWAKFIRSESDERALLAGYTFNEKRALRCVNFFPAFLRHSKGDFGGKPFELLDWQRDDLVYPLFGWLRPNGTRRYTRSYVEIPKKNGKSTIASGIGLYLLVGDREQGAEVYCAATDKKQANIVQGEAAVMVDASPALAEVLRVHRSSSTINFHATNSFMRALSGEAAGNEGWNAHAIIVDELHKWHGRKLWDALKWAFAARRQPLLFVITTAGDDPLSVCRQQHDYALGVNDGTIPDLNFFGYVRCAEDDDDWLDPATWRKANPSLGITMDEARFAEDVLEASKTPESQASFKRYRLNVWNAGENSWLKPASWKACQRVIEWGTA